jgi:hypothetical protein
MKQSVDGAVVVIAGLGGIGRLWMVIPFMELGEHARTEQQDVQAQ